MNKPARLVPSSATRNPSHSNRNSLSDLKVVWKSVEDLKAGLEQTGKRIKTINKDLLNDECLEQFDNSQPVYIANKEPISVQHPNNAANDRVLVRKIARIGKQNHYENRKKLKWQLKNAKQTALSQNDLENEKQKEFPNHMSLKGDDKCEPIYNISEADSLTTDERILQQGDVQIRYLNENPFDGSGNKDEILHYCPKNAKDAVHFTSKSFKERLAAGFNYNSENSDEHIQKKLISKEQGYHQKKTVNTTVLKHASRSHSCHINGKLDHVSKKPFKTKSVPHTMSLNNVDSTKKLIHEQNNVPAVHEVCSWPNLKKKSDLQKIKELVEKQQQDVATRIHSAPEINGSSTHMEKSSHDSNKSAGIKKDTFLTGPVRKVSVAPQVSEYSGFSIPERIQTATSKTDVKAKKADGDNKSENAERIISGKRLRNQEKKAKTTKIVKVSSNIQDYIISPSSWRKGQKLVQKELGPFKPELQEENAKDDNVKKEEDRDNNKRGSGQEVAESTVQKELFNYDVEKSSEGLRSNILPVEHGTTMKTVKNNENISSVELKKEVKENISDPDNILKETTNARKTDKTLSRPSTDSLKSKKIPPNKRKAVQQQVQEKEHPLPKVRHYDSQVVRNYIEKRRRERALQLQADKLRKQLETKERLQKLQDLQERQKKLVQASLVKRPTTGEEPERDKNSVFVVENNVVSDSHKHSNASMTHLKNPLDSKPRSRRHSGELKKKTSGALDLLHSVEQRQRLAHADSNPDSGSEVDDEKVSFLNLENNNSYPSSILLDQENITEFDNPHLSEHSSISVENLSLSKSSSLEERSSTSQTTGIALPEEKNDLQTYQDKQGALNSLTEKCQKALDEMMKKLEMSNLKKLPSKTNSSHLNVPQNQTGLWNDEKLESLRSTTEALKKRILEESIQITQSMYDGKFFSSSNTDQNLGESSYLSSNVLRVDMQTYPDQRKSISSEMLLEQKSPEFETRHTRITQEKHQTPVFEGKLPGVSNLVHHAQKVAEQQLHTMAAIKIQSCYRGYRARKFFKWKLPSGRTLGDKVFKKPTGLNSENLLGNNSALNESHFLSSRQNQYYSPSFCPSTQQSSGVKYSVKNQYSASLYVMGDQKPDPYNFINTVQRSLQQGNLWIPLTPSGNGCRYKSTKDSEPVSNIFNEDRDVARKPPEKLVHSQTQTSIQIQMMEKDLQPSDTDNSVASYSSSFPSSSSVPVNEINEVNFKDYKTSTPFMPSNEIVDKQNSVSRASVNVKVNSHLDEETLSEGTLSEHSIELHSTEKHVQHLDSKLPIDGKDAEETSHRFNKQEGGNNSSVNKLTQIQKHFQFNEQQQDLQFSPATLKLRMSTELTYLDSVEESLKQLGNMEHIQAVALAQQETVTLSQALKETHERQEMEIYKNKSEEEKMHRMLSEVREKHENLSHAVESMHNMHLNNENMSLNAQRLLEVQAEAAKITAEAAKQLAQAQMKTIDFNTSLQTINKIATDTATSAAIAAVTSALDHLHKQSLFKLDSSPNHEISEASSSPRSSKSQSSSQVTRSSYGRSRSWHSRHSSSNNSKASMKTYTSNNDSAPEEIFEAMSDVSSHVKSKKSGSVSSVLSNESIKSSLHDKPATDEDPTMSEGSIAEEIDLDENLGQISKEWESLLEEPIEDPSVVHSSTPTPQQGNDSLGKKSKITKELSDKEPVENFSQSANVLASDLPKDNSFTELTMQLVSGYIKEEEIRAKHQITLLKLREKALIDKTKQELAALKAQRKELRAKGEEDKLPNLRKRQRGLLLRLQQEQIEIRQLQEAQMLAIKERQMLLQQQKHILQLRQSTQQMLTKMHDTSPDFLSTNSKHLSGSLLMTSTSDSASHLSSSKVSRLSSAVNNYHSETENHISEEIQVDKFSIKEFEPNSELLDADVESHASLSPRHLVKKSKFSSSSIASQVINGLKKLQASKRNLTNREQKLLQRKQDVEELLSWKQKLDKEEKHIHALEVEAKNLLEQELTVQNSHISDLKSQQNGSHQFSTESLEKIVTDEQKSNTLENRNENSVVEEIFSQESSQSIPEEVPGDKKKSVSSEVEKNSDLGDYQSFFESSSSSKQKASDLTDAPVSSLEKQVQLPGVNLRLPLSPRTHVRKRQDSSGSEDSFTISQSETASDLSDIEGRIHALKEELRRRKNEAERLRKEQKRRSKERLKAQEESLMKQIEAYDKFIWQTKSQLEKEIEFKETAQLKLTVKPQIRQPKVAESRHISKLQNSAPSVLNSGQEYGEDVSPPSLQGSLQSSPVATPREEPVNSSLSEILSDKSKALSSDVIEKTETSEPARGKVETQPESDNEESTSESVKTVTEIGEVKTEIVEEVNSLSHKEEETLQDNNETELSKHLDSKDLKGFSIDAQQDDKLFDDGLDFLKENNLLSHDLIKINSDSADVNLKPEKKFTSADTNNEVMQDSQDLDGTSVTSSLLEENDFSADNKSVAEEIDADNVEEVSILSNNKEEEIQIWDDAQNVSSVGETVKHIDREFQLEEQTRVMDSYHALESDAKSVSEEEVPLKNFSDSYQENNLEVIANDMTEKLFEGLFQDALDVTTSVSSRSVKKVSSEIIPSMLQKSEHDLKHSLDTESDSSVQEEMGPDLSTSIVSKEKSDLEIFLEKFIKSILEDELNNLIPIFLKRQHSDTTISECKKSSSCSITERVTTIMNLVERNALCTKEKFPLSNVLSISAPEAYHEEFDYDPSLAQGPSLGKDEENVSDIILKPPKDESYKPNTEILSSTEQEWFDDDLGLGNEVVGYQIYPFQQYYYIREIPNKPPPPYIPPKQGNWTNNSSSASILASSEDASFVTYPAEDSCESFVGVLYSEDELQAIVHNDMDIVYTSLLKGTSPEDILFEKNSEPTSTESGGIFQKNSDAYRRFIFDLCKETLGDLYFSVDKSQSTLNKSTRALQNRKFMLLKNPRYLIEEASKQVLQLLSVKSVVREASPLALNTNNFGRKKREPVDEILVQELREEELSWITYDQDEGSVKNQLTNSLFDLLKVDTINQITTLSKLQVQKTQRPER